MLDLFESSGDVDPSLREILAATNLSTQAFYRYFTSKDELFLLSSTTAAAGSSDRSNAACNAPPRPRLASGRGSRECSHRRPMRAPPAAPSRS